MAIKPTIFKLHISLSDVDRNYYDSLNLTIARLVALVPKPRANLTRFHGVFAPNSAHRAQVTAAKRGKGTKARTANALEDSRFTTLNVTHRAQSSMVYKW